MALAREERYPAQRGAGGPASGAGPTSIAPPRSACCWTSLVPIHRRVRRSARSHFIQCWRSVYCAGLRVSEIAHLNLGDVDLTAGTIAIRETKFFKSRILPLAASVVAALREYLEVRGGGPGRRRIRRRGCSGTTKTERATRPRRSCGCSYDILRRAGLKPPRGRTGPRIHDLRHSFVVNRILEWYRAGINPQDKLPFLATYLGHRDIHSTLVYITVTQDLLQQANERFRAFGAHCLQVAEGGSHEVGRPVPQAPARLLL